MTGPTYQRALVVGATGGIGAALLAEARRRSLAQSYAAWARRPPEPSDDTDWYAVDLTDEASIAAAASRHDSYDLVVVATGVLQADLPDGPAIRPEKTFRHLDPAVLAATFQLNTIGPALVAKHVLPRLPRDRKSVFAVLSARVGSISDNRLGGWYGYRASKAALNQLVRTLAIELVQRHPHAICLGLHPGTVDTALSKPFQGGVAAEKLFPPDLAARQLLDILAQRTAADSGRVFDWAGVEVPP
jgi:NAD(P)-dependent dehydrogenase (short-subunit alcohol dehydrogenase family)